MFGDAERPARMRMVQQAALRAYIQRQIYPYSPFNRSRLTAAGFGPSGVKSQRDLARVPPVQWDDVGDGVDLVMRPLRVTITRLGNPALAFRVLLARMLGRGEALNRNVIDPVYRPIQWVVQDGVPVGMSANDLERLGEIGRRWLEAAGVRVSDMIVSIVPSGGLDYWQLSTATRRAGVSAAFLDPSPPLRDLVRLRPTVLVGHVDDVIALAHHASGQVSPALEAVHTVLLTGELLDDDKRSAINRLLGRDVNVLGAWAPHGARALWAECRGANGYHTWPAAEVLDVVHPKTYETLSSGMEGEVVWTALGWAGSVVIRLRTGVTAVIDESPCAACNRTTPRVLPVRSVANFAAVLDAHPGVAMWQGELSRRNGDDELVVFLTPARPGHPARLIRELDEDLQSTKAAAQFVVLQPEAMEQRLAQYEYSRVIDVRPI